MKKRWLLLLIPLPIVLLGIANLIYINTSHDAHTAPTTNETSNVVQTPTQEQKPTVDELLRFTNEERAKAGVPPLQLDDRLNQSAQAKADDMVANNYYGHIDPQGRNSNYLIGSTGISCVMTGENIDAGKTSAEIINEWMASPPHKKALLSKDVELTGYGIAVYSDYFYVVQHFCDL